MTRTLPVLLNVRSRKGREWAGAVRPALEATGCELTELTLYRSVPGLVARAQELVAQGAPVVAVGGGDGTLGAACKAFLGSGTAMMVFPAGTGNAFARDLGIPFGVKEAVQALAEGEVRPVDVAVAQGRHFVNVATVGLTTLIAQSLDPVEKRLVGKFAYVGAAARALARARPFEVRLTTETEEAVLTTMQVVIGNGRLHGGPFPLSPTAGIGSGRLSVYAVQAHRKSELWRYAVTLTFGGHVALPEVWWSEPQRCKVVADPPVGLTLDGEVCGNTPLEAETLPGALRVVVPRAPGRPDGVDWSL